MAAFGLDLKEGNIIAMLRDPVGIVGKDMERRAINVVALAKQNASGRPGRLPRSAGALTCPSRARGG